MWGKIKRYWTAIAIVTSILGPVGATLSAAFYAKAWFWPEKPLVEQFRDQIPKLFKREASDPFVRLAIKGLETVETQGKAGQDAIRDWKNNNRTKVRELLKKQALGEQGQVAADHFAQLAALSLLANDNDTAYWAFKKASELQPESAEIWAHRAIFEKSMSFLNDAEKSYREVLDIIDKKEKTEKAYWYICLASAGIADIYKIQSRFDEASKLLKDVIVAVKPNEMLAEVYGELGLTQWQLGELSDAKVNLIKSLDLNIKYGNFFHIIADLSTLGRIYTDLGRFDDANSHLNKAYDLYFTYVTSSAIQGASPAHETSADETVREVSWLIYVYRNFGDLYYSKNYYLSDDSLDKAEEFYQRSLEVSRQLEDIEGLMTGYIDLGFTALKKGDKTQAKSYFDKGFEKEGEISKRSPQEIYLPLGRLHEGRGAMALADHDLENAEREIKDAVRLFEKGKSVAWLAEGHMNLGIFYNTIHNQDLACKYWISARDMYSKIGMILARNKVDRAIKASCPAA
jgi:tetratricopeptide (TPR) repeat protein